MRLLLPTGELAAVTKGCLADYIDQVRPSCVSSELAYRELQRLISEHGHVSFERPEWMAPVNPGAEPWRGVPRWVLVGDVAVLVHYAASDGDTLLATAVITRGTISAQTRAVRSASAAGRRAAARARRTDGPGKARSRFRRERRDQLARESDSRRDAP